MNKGASLLLGLAVGFSAPTAPTQAIELYTSSLVARASVHPAIVIQGNNSIYGTVFGPGRRPVADIYIELLSDVYSTIDRARTDTSGRFTFRGLTSGLYKVRVLARGTEYIEQTIDVSLVPISATSGSGGASEQVDIYLKAREVTQAGGPFAAPPGVVFAQEVPDAAKKMYEKAIIDLREKRDKEGYDSLRKAVELFPNYYAALERLGLSYVMQGTPAHFEAARVLLMKAAEVNPKGFSAVFGLGLAQYKLKQMDDAIKNFQRAVTMHGQSADAQLYLGMALMQAKKAAEAEIAFKRANELGKGKGAESHFQLARLYSEQNRYREAADELELYLKANPATPDTVKIKETIQQLREKAAKK
ncbi:MAG: tetratricopeptide repeat protein [Pyrinomonadaceae bacterium]